MAPCRRLTELAKCLYESRDAFPSASEDFDAVCEQHHFDGRHPTGPSGEVRKRPDHRDVSADRDPLSEGARLARTAELRSMLDTAAERLAAAEASGRQAWRTLLQLDMRSAKEFDEVVQDELNAFSFPGGQVPGATKAVDDFAAAVDNLAMFEGRLELRLRAGIQRWPPSRRHAKSSAQLPRQWHSPVTARSGARGTI